MASSRRITGTPLQMQPAFTARVFIRFHGPPGAVDVGFMRQLGTNARHCRQLIIVAAITRLRPRSRPQQLLPALGSHPFNGVQSNVLFPAAQGCGDG